MGGTRLDSPTPADSMEAAQLQAHRQQKALEMSPI